MSKKFLFNKKEAEEEREFHSKGYHPMEKKLCKCIHPHMFVGFNGRVEQVVEILV